MLAGLHRAAASLAESLVCLIVLLFSFLRFILYLVGYVPIVHLSLKFFAGLAAPDRSIHILLDLFLAFVSIRCHVHLVEYKVYRGTFLKQRCRLRPFGYSSELASRKIGSSGYTTFTNLYELLLP